MILRRLRAVGVKLAGTADRKTLDIADRTHRIPSIRDKLDSRKLRRRFRYASLRKSGSAEKR